LTNRSRYDIINTERKERERIKMTTLELIKSINSDTYEVIAELVMQEDTEGYPLYTVQEIAIMVGVSTEAVQWVYRAECC
jgi:hypothetical protein